MMRTSIMLGLSAPEGSQILHKDPNRICAPNHGNLGVRLQGVHAARAARRHFHPGVRRL